MVENEERKRLLRVFSFRNMHDFSFESLVNVATFVNL